MTSRYEEVIEQLRRSYDGAVAERAGGEERMQAWKEVERSAFLGRLQDEGRRSLLEIGAGTGVHGRFFADAGLDVVCTDLSPAMVEHCRSRGLDAHVQDFLHLDLGRRFDAVFAMNCLLHVPRESLDAALTAVASTLEPGGLFFLGQYGGIVMDELWAGDAYEPARYFSWLTDADLLAAVAPHFGVVSFRAVDVDGADGSHFQSLVLRVA